MWVRRGLCSEEPRLGLGLRKTEGKQMRISKGCLFRACSSKRGRVSEAGRGVGTLYSGGRAGSGVLSGACGPAPGGGKRASYVIA